MAELYSQYESGAQFTAGGIVGSATGVSGVNAFVDRLNSITTDDGAYSNLTGGAGLEVNNGSVVNLTNKTRFLTIPGNAFLPTDGNNAITRNFEGMVAIDSTTSMFASVELPDRVVVTGAVVFGADAGENWGLRRREVAVSGGATTMANNSLGNEDGTITNATIDNEIYCYSFDVLNMDSSDGIYGARIAYTTDYD